MRRWIVAALGTAAVVAAVPVAAPLLVGRDRVAARIEAAATAATGLPASIEGGVAFGLLPVPWIEIEGLRLASAPGNPPGDVVRIGSIRATVHALPLLSGRVEIGEARIEGVTVTLARDAAGHGNWQPTADAAPRPAGGGDGAWVPKAVSLAAGFVGIDRFSFQPVPGGPFRSFEALELEVALRGAGADRAALLRSLRGTATVRVDTTENLGLALADVEGQVAYRGDGVWDLILAASVDGQPLRVTAEATDPDRVLVGETVALTATVEAAGRRSAAEGTVRVDRSVVPPDATLALKIDDLDLSGLVPAPDRPGRPSPADGRVIPAVPLPRADLPPFTLTLDVALGRVDLPRGHRLDEAVARLRMADGEIRVDPFSGRIAGGAVSGSVVLRPEADPPAGRVMLEAEDIALGTLGVRPTGVDLAGARLGTTLDLSAAGPDTRALAASLTGRAEFRQRGGRLHVFDAAPGLRGLSGVLDPILGAGGVTAIRCTAVRLRFDDGIGQVAGLVLDSSAAIVSGRGSLDLRRETQSLALAVRPRDAALLRFALALDVGGSFAAPAVSVAPEAVVAAAVSVAGSIVNPLGVIGVLAGASGDAAPSCTAAIDEGARARPLPLQAVIGAAGDAAGALGGAAGAVGGAAGDAVRGLGSGVRSLLGR